jgi:hypothetical protein
MSYLTSFWTSSQPEPGCLVFTDKNFARNGHLQAGGWCVPIMWSLCFAGADVHCVRKPESEWADSEQPAYGASCDASVQSAVRNIERRLPSLLNILPSHTHEACRFFLKRLSDSTEKFVHMDVSLLLESEDDPGNQEWKNHFARLLDGLDVPVSGVRRGLTAKLLGPGLPPGWKYLCRWSVSNGPLAQLWSPQLSLHQVTGAQDMRELSEWHA